MTESNVRPAPIHIRKAHHDAQDWLYIYLRSNVSERTETDEVSGEEYVIYEYSEDHIRVPLPDGVDVSVPSDHSVNQDALKAQLKDLFASNAEFRTALQDALSGAQLVDWRDRVSEWGGEPAVSIATEDNWRYWVPGENVEEGDERFYGDTLYEVRQPHRTAGHWNPDLTTPTLWLVVPQSDEWIVGAQYEMGDVVTYEGDEYECIQPHVSQADWTPDTATTLWSLVSGDEPAEWQQPAGAHDAYNTGDRVTWEGWIWESTVDANVWEPGVYGWTQVEPL